jgi:hypothetical protein
VFPSIAQAGACGRPREHLHPATPQGGNIMKVRYAKVLSLFAMMAFLAVPAFAQGEKEVLGGDVVDYPPGALVNCDLTGYKSVEIVYPVPQAIPDDNPAGFTLGPISLAADGSLIQDVVLSVNMAHTWVGDIVMDLTYDEDCTAGTPNVTTRVLCRPRGTATGPPAPCGATATAGCSGNLVATNLYQWTDGIATPMTEGACPATIPSGCFHNSTVGGGLMSVFNGLRKGGCWTLFASDNAALDQGSISRWQVSVLNSPTAAVPSTWGSVKTLYR